MRTLLPVVDNGAWGHFGLGEISLQENISIPESLGYAYIIGLTEFLSCSIFASLISCCLSSSYLKLVREIGVARCLFILILTSSIFAAPHQILS